MIEREKYFKFWCNKVLPLVYDDSLSYYELLCKVVDYLNHTIADVSTLSQDFIDLKNYVDHYFDGGVAESIIAKYVREWLDDHPEATTTVQDGSLTYPKFHDSLKDILAGAGLSPDMFSGSDAERLQAAIDYSIEHDYITIIIARKYDITGESLKINKGLYQPVTRLRRKLTFIGTNGGSIYKGDSGYMFTGDKVDQLTDFSAGDVAFINVAFRGSESYDTPNDWSNRCSVFDCHRIIRLTTINCSYSMVGVVFDGHESDSDTNNMQSINNYADVCTYSHAYYSIGYLWGANSIGCIIEQCDYGYKCASGSVLVNELHIRETTIEGCKAAGIYLDDAEHVRGGRNIVIENCYFEGNGIYDVGLGNVTYDIYIQLQFLYKCVLKGNNFVPHTNGHCIDVLVRNSSFNIDDNVCTSQAVGAYLIYVTVETNPDVIIYGNNFASSITLTNEPTVIVNSNEGGYKNHYVGLSDHNLPTNLDNLTVPHAVNSVIEILEADNATNMPTGVTKGLLTTNYMDGYFTQTLVDDAANYWFRVRTKGVGWGGWRLINGGYSFSRTALSHGNTITLPFTIPKRCAVTFHPEYVNYSVVSTLYPAIIINANASSFTFNALNADGSGPSALTNIQGVFHVEPLY